MGWRRARGWLTPHTPPPSHPHAPWHSRHTWTSTQGSIQGHDTRGMYARQGGFPGGKNGRKSGPSFLFITPNSGCWREDNDEEQTVQSKKKIEKSEAEGASIYRSRGKPERLGVTLLGPPAALACLASVDRTFVETCITALFDLAFRPTHPPISAITPTHPKGGRAWLGGSRWKA